MARLPRIDFPGVPQHLVVRGNNRGLMFRDDGDRLLATGHAQGELSELMQRVGRKFARVVNLRWGRTGSLFEGRFRSCLIDSEAYLFNCMAYIELNPVRAGIVAAPGDFRWSSYRQNASGSPRPPIAPHALYNGLGVGPNDRGKAYCEIVNAGTGDPEIERIRTSVRKCRALGSEAFCARIEGRLERAVAPRERGRPKRGRVQK